MISRFTERSSIAGIPNGGALALLDTCVQTSGGRGKRWHMCGCGAHRLYEAVASSPRGFGQPGVLLASINYARFCIYTENQRYESSALSLSLSLLCFHYDPQFPHPAPLLCFSAAPRHSGEIGRRRPPCYHHHHTAKVSRFSCVQQPLKSAAKAAPCFPAWESLVSECVLPLTDLHRKPIETYSGGPPGYRLDILPPSLSRYRHLVPSAPLSLWHRCPFVALATVRFFGAVV